MTAEYRDTNEFRGASFTHADLSGASFTGVDLSGAKFRDCDLSRIKIADAWLRDVYLSGEIGNVVVNDVDVTAFVEAELDRRHPERASLRLIRTADDHRTMWHTLERLWAGTVARAERLPEPARHERVDEEWSFVETLRHLVFATDAWASRTILDQPKPYHRLGIYSPHHPEDAAELGVELAAQPSYAEVMQARADRMAVVRRIVDGLDDAELERVVERTPGPGYPEERRTVGRCLRVIMNEECEHRRYAERDLAVLQARPERAGSDCSVSAAAGRELDRPGDPGGRGS